MQDRRSLHPTDEDLSVGTQACWSRRFECVASVYSISENAVDPAFSIVSRTPDTFWLARKPAKPKTECSRLWSVVELEEVVKGVQRKILRNSTLQQAKADAAS